MFAGGLLREDEVAVHRDFEDTATRRFDDEVRDVVFELFEDPLRQTDGSRCVASFAAVLDAYVHGPESTGSSRRHVRVRTT
jgi:hypothetical protein